MLSHTEAVEISLQLSGIPDTVRLLTRARSANEQARRLNKKTIQPKDVMDAIHEIEFDMFLPRLEGELTSTTPHFVLLSKCNND
jgi:hypothetical protein